MLVDFLIIVVLLSALIDASLIKLFDAPHFYELSSNRDANVVNANNFSQFFTTKVFGDGRCGQKTLIQYASISRYDPTQGSEIGKMFMFSAKPVIYSNDEQTLSFLIDVQFQAPQIPDIKGFEIGIEFQDQRSCIQIVPLGKIQNKPGRLTSYRLKIKDPIFMTIKQDKYTFYFGRASIKALIDCDKRVNAAETNQSSQMSWCAAENTISPSVEVGILKIKDVDISSLRTDLCTGHLMTQTCIMRYKPEDSHVIVMHPMPTQFDRVTADMDVMTYLDQSDLNKDLKPGQRALPDPDKINCIESLRRQKMENNIVFKFLNYPSDYLNYMSIVKDPVSDSPCPYFDSTHKLHQCECNQSCVDCYDYPNPQNELHYISLSKNNPKSYPMRSLHCSNEIYQAYNFDSIRLDKHFQNQRLDKPRLQRETFNSILPILNKDSVPRLCFSFDANRKIPINPIYHIKIMFNDVAKIAQSSIYNAQASYKLVLFKYEFHERPDLLVDVNLKRLYTIHLKQMASVDSLKLTSGLLISGLKQGKYLVEVTPTMKNSLCPSPDMCIDEFNRNNQFICVQCSKLIVRFELSSHLNDETNRNGVESKSDWTSRFEQLKSTFHFGSKPKEMEVGIASDLSSFIESDDLYYCSQDNAEFEKIIAQSTLFSANDNLEPNGSSSSSSPIFRSKRDFEAGDDSNDAFSQFGIKSALVKKSFDIRNLMLPFEASFASEAIIESTYADSLTSIFLIMSVIIMMLILIIVFNLVYSRLRKQMILNNFKKTVAFYLSVFVDENTQKEMTDVVKIYEKFFKKWLPSSEIFIISFSTPPSEREVLLNKADRIFYVCGTETEIQHLYEPIRIGQNAFHHDYNKLHFVDRYRSKCTNVTFNKNASIISKISSRSSGTFSIFNNDCEQSCQISRVLDNTPLKENLHTIINVGAIEVKDTRTMDGSRKEKKALLGNHGLDDSIESNRNSSIDKDTSTTQLSSSSSSTSTGPSSTYSNSFTVFEDNYKKYLKLPAENKLLIKLILFEDCDNDSCDRLSLSNYANHFKLGRFTLRLLLAKMEHDINQRVRKNFKKKKCLLKLVKNINFNEQSFGKQAASSAAQDTVFFEEAAVNRNSKFQRVSFKI